MANAYLVASVVLVFVLLVTAYFLGISDGRLAERDEADELLFPLEELVLAEERERVRAFARAAEAVTLWPHRIDKRADLARHLDSLGTAPELGAATPNPEREPQEEPRPQDTADSPSRVPSAAPVPAGEDVIEPEEADERVVDIYRNEGFL